MKLEIEEVSNGFIVKTEQRTFIMKSLSELEAVVIEPTKPTINPTVFSELVGKKTRKKRKPNTSRKRWTAEEEKKVLNGIEQGYNYNAIGKSIGRSYKAICLVAHKLRREGKLIVAKKI